MWVAIISFLGPLFASLLGTIGNITKSLVPQIYKTLMKYMPVFVWLVFFSFALHFVAPLLAFVLYSIDLTFILFLAPFCTSFTIALIIHTFLAILVLALGKLIYTLLRG